MVAKVRHQLFLPKPLSDRLEALASARGVCRSRILADAVDAWLTKKGADELDDRFGPRLDRIATALGRIERDGHVHAETLALFVRYELSIHAPLAEGDHAGRAIARERFDAFVRQVARAVASGARTLAPPPGDHR